MYDIIKDILTSPAGSFGSMFALILFIAFLIYKAGRIVEKFGIVEKLERNIEKIKEEIKAFMNIIRQKYNPLAQNESPITLTKQGENVSNALNIKRIISSNWDDINKKIKRVLKKDDNPYSIQQICFDIGKRYSKIVSESEMDYIKTYAFKHGYNLYDFDIVFGLEIRNAYFQQEGITISDIDAHDPGKKNNPSI